MFPDRRIPISKSIHLLPSLFTTGSMFCSFFSIIRSINGDYYAAAWAIFVASFFDLVDGRLARMTRTQSDFGKEYDSLVDLASFGLAPAILSYTWTLKQFHPVGWIFSFLFFACAALRLARFNVKTEAVEKRRFQGLPSPPAACLLASFVLFCQSLYGEVPVRSPLALVLVPALALLMVSNIPYRSFKEYDVRMRNSFYVLIGIAMVIGLIAINPDIVIFLGFLIYALSGPVGVLIAGRRRKGSARTESKVRVGFRRRLAVLKPQKDNETGIVKKTSA